MRCPYCKENVKMSRWVLHSGNCLVKHPQNIQKAAQAPPVKKQVKKAKKKSE